jgi:hypothetical protein
MASVLKVDKLDPQSGTALEIGTSGDTVSIPSGATLDISSATLTPPATMPASSGINLTALNATNLGSGTVPTARLGTGTASSSTVLYGDQTYKAEPGGTNTPAFNAYLSTGQTLTADTSTKVAFDTEWFDTDGCYDKDTNYRFLPTTAGKYLISASVQCYGGGDVGSASIERMYLQLKKNGSAWARATMDIRDTGWYEGLPTLTNIMDFNGSSDYVEVWVEAHVSAGVPMVDASWQGAHQNHFFACLLIGV